MCPYRRRKNRKKDVQREIISSIKFEKRHFCFVFIFNLLSTSNTHKHCKKGNIIKVYVGGVGEIYNSLCELNVI